MKEVVLEGTEEAGRGQIVLVIKAKLAKTMGSP